MSLKEMTKEDRRKYDAKKQKKYHDWKRISKEFMGILLEKSEKEIEMEEEKKRKKKEEQEARRIEKKEEKHQRIREEKECEKARKKREKNKANYQKYKKDIQEWRKNNREHYNEMAKLRQRRYLEKKKIKENLN